MAACASGERGRQPHAIAVRVKSTSEEMLVRAPSRETKIFEDKEVAVPEGQCHLNQISHLTWLILKPAYNTFQ